MKVLHLGYFGPDQSEWSIKKGFENQGHEVVTFDFRTPMTIDGKSMEERDNLLVEFFDKEKPDLTFFQKAKGIDVDVVKHCNKTSKTFIWYMDPMNNMCLNIESKIEFCHNTGLALYEVYDIMKKNYPNVHFINDGSNPNWDHPITIGYQIDIGFIGQHYGKRRDRLDALGIEPMRGFYRELHAAAINATKINLCFTDSGIWGKNGWSARAYKVMASSGFLLVEKFPFMEKYNFKEGVHFVAFDGTNDLLRKVDYYLIHEEEREAIALAGYKHVQNYSRYNLVEKILEIVNA